MTEVTFVSPAVPTASSREGLRALVFDFMPADLLLGDGAVIVTLVNDFVDFFPIKLGRSRTGCLFEVAVQTARSAEGLPAKGAEKVTAAVYLGVEVLNDK